MFAIRIILESQFEKEKQECWQAYSIVTDMYQPNPKRLRDWLSVPKSNGYESLHITVMGPEGKWVEVQIRTERMDDIAERGLAAHWRYKGVKGESGLDEWLTSIREALENTENDLEMMDSSNWICMKTKYSYLHRRETFLNWAKGLPYLILLSTSTANWDVNVSEQK